VSGAAAIDEFASARDPISARQEYGRVGISSPTDGYNQTPLPVNPSYVVLSTTSMTNTMGTRLPPPPPDSYANLSTMSNTTQGFTPVPYQRSASVQSNMTQVSVGSAYASASSAGNSAHSNYAQITTHGMGRGAPSQYTDINPRPPPPASYQVGNFGV